jgi:hypothetical protein
MSNVGGKTEIGKYLLKKEQATKKAACSGILPDDGID